MSSLSTQSVKQGSTAAELVAQATATQSTKKGCCAGRTVTVESGKPASLSCCAKVKKCFQGIARCFKKLFCCGKPKVENKPAPIESPKIDSKRVSDLTRLQDFVEGRDIGDASSFQDWAIVTAFTFSGLHVNDRNDIAYEIWQEDARRNEGRLSDVSDFGFHMIRKEQKTEYDRDVIRVAVSNILQRRLSGN